MKTAKIIATYLGPRRFYIDSREKTKEHLTSFIEYEREFDCGLDCDLIIVDHTFDKEFTYDCLNDFNYKKTKNGTIKVISRDWNDGIGMSFYSYMYAYDLLKYDYNYWFFSEDDIQPLKPNYIKEMKDMLLNDSNIGFVGALNVLPMRNVFVFDFSKFDENGYLLKMCDREPYCPGGIGFTSSKLISEVIHKYGSYPLCTLRMPDELQKRVFNNNYQIEPTAWESWYAEYVDKGEIPFTNVYTKLGYKIKLYSDGSAFKRIQWNDVC